MHSPREFRKKQPSGRLLFPCPFSANPQVLFCYVATFELQASENPSANEPTLRHFLSGRLESLSRCLGDGEITVFPDSSSFPTRPHLGVFFLLTKETFSDVPSKGRASFPPSPPSLIVPPAAKALRPTNLAFFISIRHLPSFFFLDSRSLLHS